MSATSPWQRASCHPLFALLLLGVLLGGGWLVADGSLHRLLAWLLS